MIHKPKRSRGRPALGADEKRKMVSIKLRPAAIDRLKIAGREAGSMGKAIEQMLGL